MNRKIVFIVSAVVLLLVFAGGALLYKSEKVQRWGKLVGQNQAALASAAFAVARQRETPRCTSSSFSIPRAKPAPRSTRRSRR